MSRPKNQKKIKASDVLRALKESADKTKAKIYPRFFKSGPGEYGEGDQFLGVTVPKARKVAAAFQAIALDQLKTVLSSKWHEARLTALLILVRKFKEGDQREQKNLQEFYFAHLKWVNNWDLVDTSAPYIAGPFLFSKYTSSSLGKSQVLKTLVKLSDSKNLWDRRVAILATFYFIRQNEYGPTLTLAKHLLEDEHDLIHKAVGWMLREVGNRSMLDLETFLTRHLSRVPRTTLRYAIEKFPLKLKAKYMAGS